MSDTHALRLSEIRSKIEELEQQISDLRDEAEGLDPDSALRPFELAQLHQIDHGSIGTEFNYAVRRVYEHINRYPYRVDGDAFKAVSRSITMSITFLPELKMDNKTITAQRNAAFASLNPVIRSILTDVKIKTGLPDFSTNAIRLRTTLDKNQIVTTRFHPEDNENDIQRHLPYDDSDD